MSFRDRACGLRNIAIIVAYLILMVFGLAVVGLYAQDLNKARKEGKYSDGKWVFATVTASLSAVTGLVYALFALIFETPPTVILFAWDWILTILWAAVLAIFGPMYLHENPEMDAGVLRMKHAVYVDIVNFGLWFIVSAVMTAVFFMSNRGKMGLWHGRRSRGMGGKSESVKGNSSMRESWRRG